MSPGQRLLDVAEECVHELLWHVEHLERLSHYARRSSAIRNWLSGRLNHSSKQSHNTRFFISSKNLHQICYYLFMLVRDHSKQHFRKNIWTRKYHNQRTVFAFKTVSIFTAGAFYVIFVGMMIVYAEMIAATTRIQLTTS
ncbi:hypothetical protein TcasGA2_TC004848 [Tribolium castaneum]|uniref:Uncharacterized protein n=1 Tax=Tribolium castaneum TaxID=7070 RepID=D6WAZ8_TRICA|nr:hypothetical protein TcasGA2_TC004848 [Tribolium castaneum]